MRSSKERSPIRYSKGGPVPDETTGCSYHGTVNTKRQKSEGELAGYLFW